MYYADVKVLHYFTTIIFRVSLKFDKIDDFLFSIVFIPLPPKKEQFVLIRLHILLNSEHHCITVSNNYYKNNFKKL